MKLINSMLLVLLIAPLAACATDPTKAQIVTSMSKGAGCIAPVHIRKIDGREVSVNRGGFELEPGKHTMSGTAKIDTSVCSVVGRGTDRDATPPLEAEFEAGKEYWVGLDHGKPNRKDWEYVIWKVKDLEK